MSHPEITIDQGRLRGSVAKDLRGDLFLKFQGIPYAKPPLGNLRFKSPQPPEKWSGVLDATKEGDICYSRDPLKQEKVEGSENCLFLNVYTKKLQNFDSGELSPVLFWIHGGGLIWGSGNEELYGPEFLLTEDVVFVTINYRLGLLGFLSLEDPSLEVPGNAGFKDQIMALKWVQKNISKFGGDPNNVTIFGESAGATSTHLLMLSPMSKGLFHRVIAQSASALTNGLKGKRNFKILSAEMGLGDADEKVVFHELMKKSPEELLQIQEKLDIIEFSKQRFLGFVVEKHSKDPFLDEEPLKIIKSGKFNHVPFMAGYTSCEGLFFAWIKPNKSEIFNFGDCLPWDFGYQEGTPEIEAAAKKLKKFYFGDEEDSEKIAPKKYDVLSDCVIVYSVHLAVENQYPVSKAPTYLYRMSVDTELNFFKKLLNINSPGTSHLDDVGYLFKNNSTPEIKPGSAEDSAVRKIVKLWANFAKFGNPTPDENDPLLKTVWKPVTGKNLDFLDIGQELVPLSNPDTERFNFWKSLYAESPAGRKQSV